MNLKKIATSCNLNQEEIYQLKDAGLLDDESEIDDICHLYSLLDLGLDFTQIQSYTNLEKMGDCSNNQRIEQLQVHRSNMLDHLHKYQKYLDSTDQLIYELKRNDFNQRKG